MKRKKVGGYPTWKCRRCGDIFTDPTKRFAIDVPDYNCSSRLVLYDGENWYYMQQEKPHYCKDLGIGLADFIGLSPDKIK